MANGARMEGIEADPFFTFALAKRDDTEVRVLLLGDAVGAAVAGQQLPDGYYHLDRMVHSILHRGRSRLLRQLSRCARGAGGPAGRGSPPFESRRADGVDALGRPRGDLLITVGSVEDRCAAEHDPCDALPRR
jgi:hypothetical protein